MAEAEKSIAHWQGKYRAVVREQAANEARYEKQLDLLRHTIGRVGAVAHGTDKHLDELLEALKNELRRKGLTRGLLELIRDIEKSTNRITQSKSAQTAQLRNALQQILALLAGTVSSEQQELIDTLTAEVQHGVEPSQLTEMLPRMLALLGEQLTQHNLPPATNASHNNEHIAEQPFSVVGDAITAVIEELIGHITPPESAVDSLQRVRAAIERRLNWYELVPTLEELSLVIVSTLFDEQKEFEHYLKQLFEQLGQLHASLASAELLNSVGIDKRQELQAALRHELADLGQMVEQSADVDTLKLAVSRGLDVINGRLLEFTAVDTEPQDGLRDQLRSLTEQVTSLQREAGTARDLLEQQRLKALRDPLTQLPNRQAYNERSVLEFKRWQRYRRPLSLVIGDIDLFKKVNDTYGHLAGDKVLSVIAGLFRKRLRQTDFIARYGGEEMVLLLPETTGAQALTTIDSVRLHVAECGFHFAGEPLQVTMSFGMTELVDGDSLDAAFARADKALYQAKNNGRNQCTLL